MWQKLFPVLLFCPGFVLYSPFAGPSTRDLKWPYSSSESSRFLQRIRDPSLFFKGGFMTQLLLPHSTLSSRSEAPVPAAQPHFICSMGMTAPQQPRGWALPCHRWVQGLTELSRHLSQWFSGWPHAWFLACCCKPAPEAGWVIFCGHFFWYLSLWCLSASQAITALSSFSPTKVWGNVSLLSQTGRKISNHLWNLIWANIDINFLRLRYIGRYPWYLTIITPFYWKVSF